MSVPHPYFCAAWLMMAFVIAGTLQVIWLYCDTAKRFSIPLDGGSTFRGMRLFGDNKTWRGFVVMVPAVGMAFVLLGLLRKVFPDALMSGLWPLSVPEYGLLGCWTGLWFMLAELPNSFLKRQLGVQPGHAPDQRMAGVVCFILDQVDSVVGALLALSVFVPVPAMTWIVLLLSGGILHWLFNLILFLVGAKERPA
jgi:hypothetical protein